MREFLHYLFLPNESNQFRARTLHYGFFINYILILLFPFMAFLVLIVSKPGILGITANFAPAQIIAKTNEARIKAGIGNLSENQKLSQAAQKKAEDMVSKDYWAHYAPDGKAPWDFIREAGYNFTAAGENLARDFDNLDPMISAWLASPSHAENLLSTNYSEIGIGVASGVIAGRSTTVIVQMFAKPTFVPVAQVLPKPAQVTTTLEGQPLKAEQAQINVAPIKKEVINVEELVKQKPASFNYFLSTKITSLAVVSLILFLVLADLGFAKVYKIARVGSNPAFHLVALLLILFAVWYSNSGLIL